MTRYFFESSGQRAIFMLLEEGIDIKVEDRPKVIELLNKIIESEKTQSFEEGKQAGVADAIDRIKGDW